MLTSVAAWPLGGGVGSLLMQEIVNDADEEHVEVRLTVSSHRTVTVYRRWDFTATSGRRMLCRPGCRSSGASISKCDCGAVGSVMVSGHE